MASGRAKAFIQARIAVEDRGYETPCWVWQKVCNPKGYAKSHFADLGKNKRVHRVSYELYVGPIPEGLTLDHLCRVKSCVNPAHLEPVTALENIRRAVGFSAKPRRRLGRNVPGRPKGSKTDPALLPTHCKHGHEYTPENTGMDCGKRRCRECSRANDRRRYWREKVRAELGGGQAKFLTRTFETHIQQRETPTERPSGLDV